jgi:hypothetical protein
MCSAWVPVRSVRSGEYARVARMGKNEPCRRIAPVCGEQTGFSFAFLRCVVRPCVCVCLCLVAFAPPSSL